MLDVAANIDQFAKVGITEATEFKHIDRPRDLPVGPLQDLCELLNVFPRGAAARGQKGRLTGTNMN
jgi:hypothetical protein